MHVHAPGVGLSNTLAPSQANPPEPACLLDPTLKKLAIIYAGVCRLLPHYILAQRVVLAFAISRLDYMFESA